MAESKNRAKTYRIALLVSLACVLQISESLIPHPIPGLRLGLANMLTLTALVTLGFRYALEIAILRAILSSFVMGTFMSPTFVLSFSGAVISTLMMGLFYYLSSLHNRYRLSIIGISIVGAFTHNMVQLYLAYLILVKHPGVFVFLPWLGVGSVVTGWVIGIVTGGVCQKLKDFQRTGGLKDIQIDHAVPLLEQYWPGNSFLHHMSAEMKIIILLVLSLMVLILNLFWLYAGLFLLLAAVAFLSHTPLAFLFSRVRRYLSFVLAALLIPVFFNSGSHILLTIAYLKITYEGLSTGALFACRIVFLILFSALLVRTTSPEGMTRGLGRLLSPLRYLGISEQRVATILSLSWSALPALWETSRATIREADLTKVKNLRKLMPLLSDLIARLYLQTEPEGNIGEALVPKKTNRLLGQHTKG